MADSDIVAVTEGLVRHKEMAVVQLLAPFKHPILVAGGYKGDTVAAIRIVDPNAVIHVFEPQTWCLRILVERFRGVDGIHIHPFALGDRDERVTLHRAEGDMASLVDTTRPEQPTEKVQMIDTWRYFREKNIKAWSLMILNMEGYEYTLIPHLYHAGILYNVDELLVQCHPKVVASDTVGPAAIPAVPGFFHLAWSNYPAWMWWTSLVPMPHPFGVLTAG